jgi:hypothetical protein
MVQSSSLMLKSQSAGTVGILGIEEIKRLNMVEFLSRHYGLNFSKVGVGGVSAGGQYRCLSPFNDEHNPSFLVREVDGHWLFKDFSSGHGGSLIDFVLFKENFGSVGEALSHIEHLLCVESGGGIGQRQLSIPLPSPSFTSFTSSTSSTSSTSMPSSGKPYDLKLLYNTFRRTLGVAASLRPDDVMVEAPVAQALELTGGKGPQRFLLSDNGPQYISTKHGDFLEKLAILQKRIPSCRPEYNGSVECGIKEFKNVFYNVWTQIEESDLKGLGEEELLLCVQLVMNETMRRLNEEIPRPRLKGVTPADVLKGMDKERIEINRRYLEKEQEKEKKEVNKPWNCKDWGFVRKHLFKGTISNLELMTKFCFFLKQPLRKLAK